MRLNQDRFLLDNNSVPCVQVKIYCGLLYYDEPGSMLSYTGMDIYHTNMTHLLRGYISILLYMFTDVRYNISNIFCFIVVICFILFHLIIKTEKMSSFPFQWLCSKF